MTAVIIKKFTYDNTDIEVINMNGCLHMYDLDMPGTKSLTNAMNRDYLNKVKRHFKESINQIYLYHTDGVITKWKRNDFHYVSYEDPNVFAPYMALCLEKRKKWAI